MSDQSEQGDAAAAEKKTRPLSDAAKRALAEAEARRRKADAQREDAKSRELELNGRDGPEPTRYGDWEKDGIISDF